MDKYLGKYLNFLKENHLYHNSLIIIASDHSISNDWLKSKEEDNVSFQIPLYIVNSPQKIDKKAIMLSRKLIYFQPFLIWQVLILNGEESEIVYFALILF
ncbi:hypothetical protein SFC43_00925 [Bacteroides sp. CR5/BHMF/2]|nr:hypothetical protein [Bacteroides sp. CR5/BHMF/2]